MTVCRHRALVLLVTRRVRPVRGDSAYGNSTVVAACRRAGARFSLVLTKTRALTAAITAIAEAAWTPVNYPGAVPDPETGEWISDAEVAEIPFTAFASTSHPVTARLIVQRVKDARYRDVLFPIWRYHPFLTDTDEPVDAADITTAATPSSKPCSPTSSTDPWPTCPPGVSARTRPGSCARPSRTTCCVPPASWPAGTMPGPRDHPAAAHRQHPRPTGPPSTTIRPAPTRVLALGQTLAHAMAQHHWTTTTTTRDTLTIRPQARRH